MSENRTEAVPGGKRYLSPINVWALSFGCAVGWGAFVMPGTTFLPKAGPLGTSIGLIVGALVMFIIEGMMPRWFEKVDEYKTPVNALKFLTLISLFIPLLGRTAIGWIVDVNTVGATIAYAYTSVCAYIEGGKEKTEQLRSPDYLAL